MTPKLCGARSKSINFFVDPISPIISFNPLSPLFGSKGKLNL